jgi:hypothetical protein
MADDNDKKDSEEKPTTEPQPGDGPEAPPEEDEDDEERPRITLDRYMGQRRRTSPWSWIHLVVLVFMLASLVLLLMYKDRCGRAVSGFIFLGTPDRGAPVKIKMDPEPTPKSPPSSRP